MAALRTGVAPTSVLVLHPGAMGATVAAALADGGHEALWVSAGRSPETSRRAGTAGTVDVATLDDGVARASVIISVCPPAAALEMATDVAAACAATGSAPLYVDVNAVSPDTAGAIGAVVVEACGGFVDGGIIGPPAERPRTTRLYLSGTAAGTVADLFRDSKLEPIVVVGGTGAASALKMAYAAWTKGSSALLLVAAAAAAAYGVEEDLAGEWARSQPHLADQLAMVAPATAPRAWRFVGEMEQIAATMAARDLPSGFHDAAADVYRRLADFRDRAGAPPTVDEVTEAVRRR